MTKITVGLTDGSGDSGYGVVLDKEAGLWTDNSTQNHTVSEMTQGGNVSASGGDLICKGGGGYVPLTLKQADWNMGSTAKGNAYRQMDTANPIENDWQWRVVTIA